MDWGALKDIITMVLAIFGAALSTFNWFHARKRDKRSLRVSTRTVMLAYGSHLGEPWAKVEATNDGIRPVTVRIISFQTPDKKRIFNTAPSGLPGLDSTPLPCTLKDGESASFFISYANLSAALRANGYSGTVRLTPIAEDSAGSAYYDEPLEVDPNEFAR